MKNGLLSSIPVISILIFICAMAPSAYAVSIFPVNYISPGETISGKLDSTDGKLQDGSYFDSYLIDTEVGALLVITLSSESMDSYLVVTAPDGRQWDNDDYSTESGLDSRVSLLVDERGRYEIICSTYENETGRYRLSIERRERPDYYGIFIGIKNYGDKDLDLPHCDEDAQGVYDTMISSGLMPKEHGILLTNKKATTESVENAFHAIGANIGPDDLFVFFFSGHGAQVPVEKHTKTNELDGMDESLSLSNGELIDNRIGELLDEIDTGLIVCVFDACNSGGIAPDIITKGGRVCFASSEEDMLSDLAPEFEAGGYLSVFFREALVGSADLDNDGIIMMGELTRFFLRRYYQEVPSPALSMYGYQELVHDRGLVSQDTIFCWWFPWERKNNDLLTNK